ncbi:pyrroline-5-carboxylate reductase [Hydrocarboniclastica marina]|uniref:Pyrroline-5-carboxylate reductase n=1 Tax=Hydrocarboniclastica marina TaxID=2259620 RepID=A0A4P7XEH8_9ALTE|nr:pyrroline-5-carboxylate reductase [Hydrocarboniclastica marina]QCF24794.1 pyrroline-5-carboxylate reductase [Hydrocarboniclastica marina]
MSKQPTIGFIGAGNMASAIIGGMLAERFKPEQIWASAPDDRQLQSLAKRFGINTTTDNRHCATQADVLVLAVKPQVMQEACSTIHSVVQNTRPLIVSIAAGLDAATLESWLGGELPIVRCMPNTPALVGQGASALYATPAVSAPQRQLAEQIFASVGLAVWLDEESQMHAVTALSGSGPAYCFLFLEALEDAARNAGLDAAVARQLAIQTLAGAAKMARDSGDDPATLKRNVMSPGGTTEKAIETFETADFSGIVASAYEAARTRSGELAEQLRKSAD